MIAKRRLSVLIVSLLTAVGLVFSPGTAQAGNSGSDHQGDRGKQVRLTQVGKPQWAPVDLQVFSAEIGTAASEYAEFCQQSLKILSEPKHTFHPDLCVGPGKPHRPPYNKEIGRGVDALDLHEGRTFTVPEFSNGQGVWLAWMNVPRRGAWGSSPDFDSGPIIPNALFPISVDATAYHDGNFFSALADFSIPPLDAITPPFPVDGHSHVPVFIVDNRDFGPVTDTVATGNYTWHLTMRDQTGAGWDIDMSFRIQAADH